MITRLVAATRAHFEWARAGDESSRSRDGLRLPPGALETPEVLTWIERAAREAEHAIGAPSVWLMVHEGEAVGVIGWKGAPRAGHVEVGYGVAASRRARGHATRAVAAAIEHAAASALDLVAQTRVDNVASHRVLERNGFTRCGEHAHPEDGRIVTWHRTCAILGA